jgi:hypothetical protein
MSRSPLAVLLPLLLAGCGSSPPSVEEYLSIVPQAVRAAAEDARAAAPRGSGTGPLLVDVKSFAAGSHRATGEVIPRERAAETLRRELGVPFQDTPPDSSFNCLEMELGNSCWVPKNGVFVHLNVASRAPERMTLHVASTVTASNYIPPVLCDRILRMDFVRREGKWTLESKEPTKSC